MQQIKFFKINELKESLEHLRSDSSIKRETHDKSVVVEWLPRSAIDIMGGSKVKIMGIDLNYKCV